MNIAKPVRATRSFTKRLVAAPSAVFPLPCPVREADWIEGWDPISGLSASGVAEVDCACTTGASPSSAIWHVTRHERDNAPWR